MEKTREVGIGVILSFTDGHMMAEFSEVHEFLEWIVGYEVWTHQIPRVVTEIVQPYLLSEFPSLASIKIPDGLSGREAVEAYLEELYQQGYADTYTVKKITERTEQQDPLVELGDILAKRGQ